VCDAEGMPPVLEKDIHTALLALGLHTQDVEVHASLASFGRVRGGVHTVVTALIAVCRTVLVPTFSFEHQPVVAPPADDRPRQNGLDYVAEDAEQHPPQAVDVAQLTSPTCIDRDMGIIPRTILQHPGVVRSRHPFQSFAAMGEYAALYMQEHPDTDPLRPLKRLYQRGGYILLIGCDLDSCTAVHLAEELAGRKPFIRWYLSSEGRIRRVALSSCSDGFVKLRDAVKHLGRYAYVGQSTLVSYPIQALVDLCARLMAESPAITLCDARDGQGCPLCQDAAKGGPVDE
jgi:aminoglycoside 3-N-acetyltransferase